MVGRTSSFEIIPDIKTKEDLLKKKGYYMTWKNKQIFNIQQTFKMFLLEFDKKSQQMFSGVYSLKSLIYSKKTNIPLPKSSVKVFLATTLITKNI